MKPVLITALALFGFSAMAQNTVAPKKKASAKGQAKVTGDVKNMPDGPVILQLLRANDIVTVVDSVRATASGHFELPVKTTEPELYRLVLPGKKFVFLALTKESVQVTGDWNNLDNYTTKGSKGSEELTNFIMAYRQNMQGLNAISMRIDSLKKSGNDSLANVNIKEIEQAKQKSTAVLKTEAANTSYEPIAILAARMLNPSTEGPFLKDFDASLSKRFPGTGLTKDFNEFYQKATKGSTAPEVGDMAPEVALSTPDGKTVALSSLKGHYVLLDFWASWCGPCRGENPNVVAAYKKYKDKNFTIYGVSLDNNKEPWEKAITADGLTWTQVSELKGWSSQVAAEYGIRSIPQNFLIDPSGKIIAHNLRGTDLENKLSSTLK